MEKNFYSNSTATALNLEKSRVTCVSAGHVESQGQSVDKEFLNTSTDKVFQEIEKFLEKNRGMTFLLNFNKIEGWMCEFGVARHTDLIAEFQGKSSGIIEKAFTHAKLFVIQHPNFYCSKTLESQGVKGWESF